MTDSKMTPDESFRAELAEWLRTEYDPDTAHADLISRALSYITTLEAERDRLRGALRQIDNGEGAYGMQALEYKNIARAALNPTGAGEAG